MFYLKKFKMLSKGITNQNHALHREKILQMGNKKEQKNNFPKVRIFLHSIAKNWTHEYGSQNIEFSGNTYDYESRFLSITFFLISQQ